MPEPQRLYHSADVPDFSSYPASPEEAIGRARLLEVPNRRRRLDLEAGARRIGETLGRAIARVRGTKEQVLDRVADATYEVRTQVGEAAENYSNLAQTKIEEVRDQTRHLVTTARRDYPVQLILGAAAAGLLLGAGLRVWRENRG